MTRPRLIIGAAIVGLLAVAGGVAYAQSVSVPAAPTAAISGLDDKPRGPHHHGGKNPMRQIEHGEFTARVNNQDQVFDVQQGQATEVSATSLSVKSLDGFTATYVVDGNTKVRKNRGNAAIGDVQTGDQVHVVAGKSGTTVTAQRIFDGGTAPK